MLQQKYSYCINLKKIQTEKQFPVGPTRPSDRQ
jgi:hypothetical protein